MAISIKHQAQPVGRKKDESVLHTVSGLWKSSLQGFTRPIKPSELLFFTSQLSLMLEIETPLNVALKAIRDQTDNEVLKGVIEAVIGDIEDGRQLSDAMKKHPRVFSSVFTSMIRAGESGGFLKEILDRIVDIQEKNQALVTRLRSALTYPAVLCIVAMLVIVFIMLGVLPKFTAFFAGKEEVLPGITRFFMVVSVSLQSYWWAYAGSGIGLLLGLALYRESPQGRNAKDWLIINFPLVARLSNKIYTCQLFRTLGHLMESHVPLIESLEVTRGAINNLYFRHLIDKIIIHVQEGGKFAQPFAGYPYLLESVKQMVATGEEAGNLSKVMLRLTDFYDAEVDQELKIFASMIEPVALIIMGVVIGLIVSSVILPLFKLAHVVH